MEGRRSHSCLDLWLGNLSRNTRCCKWNKNKFNQKLWSRFIWIVTGNYKYGNYPFCKTIKTSKYPKMMESARFQSATRKAASVANYHHGTLEHDVPVTECDYWISGMRVVKPSRRKPPFPTVQQNTGDGNTQGSPSGDSHGLADFHLRCLISCRRK